MYKKKREKKAKKQNFGRQWGTIRGRLDQNIDALPIALRRLGCN
jgi:hypothetical protein